MNHRAGAPIGLFGSAAIMALLQGVCAANGAASRIVIIEGVAYQPATMTVKRGERVKWINKDPFPHTVTVPGSFDSHSIAAGGSWTHTMGRSGSFAYGCTLHPNMSGKVLVQ